MNLIDLSENILKDLIFNHLFVELSNNKASDSYFLFQWNESQSQIIYQDVDMVVQGNSCWEDSKEEKVYTQANQYNIDFFGQFFDSFFIEDYILHKQFENNLTDEYLYYLDHHKNEYDYSYFIYEEIFKEDYDSYYNHNRVRKLIIHVDEILSYFKTMPFIKSLNKVSEIFTHVPKEHLNTLTLFSDLNTKIPEKNKPSKKPKL